MSDNDFQWRRQMRDLSGPQQPPHDLWLGIAARIAAEQAAPPAVVPAPSRRRWAVTFAAAASVLLGVLIATLWSGPLPEQGNPVAASKPDAASVLARMDHELKQMRPHDPRLAGAAVELDTAATEIQQMLQQQPDAVFLVGLLNRTNERRLKLARMGLASS